MCRKKVLFLWLMLCLVVTVSAADKRFTLVIDAGHGGHDAGALGAFSKEKNINLNVALAFGRYVEKNCPDVRVIYTRKTDVFIALHERANIANRNKADLFISIHTNALPKGRIARGLETYTLGMNRASDNFDVAARENSVILIEKDYKQRYEGFDPRSSESYIMFEFMQDKNMAQSVELAKVVQRRACAATGRQNKGVKQAGFLVLRETSMPSCLIELGFITTPDEEKYLNSAAGIDALGKGIYQAFVDYRSKYDKSAAAGKTVAAAVKGTVAGGKSTLAGGKGTLADGKNVAAGGKVAAGVVPQEVKTVSTENKRNKRNGKPAADVAKSTGKSIIAELADARNGVVQDKSAEDASAGTAAAAGNAQVAQKEPSADNKTVAAETKTAVPKAEKEVAQEAKQETKPAAKPEAKPEAKQEVKPAVKTEAKADAAGAKQSAAGSGKDGAVATVTRAADKQETADTAAGVAGVPVFKVQVMASNRNMSGGEAVFKGLENIESYEEGGLYKYTYGASADYNEIAALRKSILDRFPEAFVVAFRDGVKMNVAEAIREFKNNKNKR